jgi:hypothetical protein
MAKFDFNEGLPAKKPSRAGWVVAGLVAILGGGFVGAFYLPLNQAHALLMTKHEQLASKTQELDQALKKSGATLKSSSAQLSEVQKALDDAKSAESAFAGEVSALAAQGKKGLDKLITAKHVSATSNEFEARFSSKGNLVFRPNSAAVLPFASKFVCPGASAVSGKPSASVTIQVSPSSEDKDAYAKAGEQAGALADLLRSACKVPASQVRASVAGSDKPGEVSVVLSPGRPPHLPHD